MAIVTATPEEARTSRKEQQQESNYNLAMISIKHVVLISLGLLPVASAFLQQSTSPLEVRLRVPFQADDILRLGRSTTSSRLYVASPRKPESKLKKRVISKKNTKGQQSALPPDQEEDKPKGTPIGQTTSPPRFIPPTPHDENRGSKFRKLKDMIWIRETVEDLTAAEFACSVEASSQQDNANQRRRRKRAVDYDKLLAQLNKRLRDLGCGIADGDTNTDVFCELEPGLGMGTTVYNDEEREELFE